MAGSRESALKGVETRRKRYSAELISANARKGGKVSTRGHFGKLKDEGRDEEIKHYSKKAISTKKQKNIGKVVS